MNCLEEYISRKTNDKYKIWSINTTFAKIIGQEKSKELQREISNWDSYQDYSNKYGLLIDRPSRFINIYFLTSLKAHGKLFCLPQAEPGIILNLSLFKNQFKSKWIYEKELTYDSQDNFEFNVKGFSDWIYSPAVEANTFIQLAQLLQSGFGDVSCLENYYTINEDKLQELIDVLNSEKEPELEDVLGVVEYFCLDYKGEDLGYGTLFEIYSSKNINYQIIEDIIDKFDHFKSQVNEVFLTSKGLKQLEEELLNLMKMYGC